MSLKDRTKSIASNEIAIQLAICLQKRYQSVITPFNLVWFIRYTGGPIYSRTLFEHFDSKYNNFATTKARQVMFFLK